MRLIDADDVIYYVDKHTHENAHGEIVLDDDISVIMEKCPAYRILVTKDRGGSDMTIQNTIYCMKAMLCEEVCEECDYYGKTGTDHCEADAVRMAIKALEEQLERKKARWIDGHCSNCGCDVPAYIIDWKWQKDMDAKYCPNCGCRMVGESK